MDGAMGMEEEVVEAVFTCEGDFHDPELVRHLERFKQKLTALLLTDKDKLNLKKVEPWNSVKVTLTIPKEAALRLRQLAQSGNDTLKEMGVLSVQIQGDSSISLTIAGRNNETTELMLRPSVGIPGTSSSVPFSVGGVTSELAASSSNDIAPLNNMSSEEVTRKNIVDYLTQGPSRRQNATLLYDSVLGAGPSSGNNTVPETNLGISPSPNVFPGQMGSGLPARPSHMPAMTSLPNTTKRGSHMNTFPLSKGNGAFHIPMPNQSSAGQGSSGMYAQRMNSAIVKTSSNQSGPLSMPSVSPQLKNLPGGMNTFGPVGLRLPPSVTVPVNMNNALPPSSSPGIMMDLPPPPPYPHSSANNTQRPGKQVSASSPLLVNLLQTDPLVATAGVASGNPNKAITAGDSSSAPPPKKKRPKKWKDGTSKSTSKPVISPESLSNKRDIIGPSGNVFNPIHNKESSRAISASASNDFASISLSKFTKESLSGGATDSRIGISATHIAEPVREPIKPLASTDRPYSESVFVSSSSSTLSNLGPYISSAIDSGNSRSIGSNGQSDSPQEASDLFSMEIAAGKIINPYTGQLEPRDSVLESNGGRMRDNSVYSQEASALTASKAKRDVGNSSFKNVPVSASQLVDINLLRTCPTVSSSTAVFVHSGPPTQISSDRLPSNVPSHGRNVISDNIDGPMNIYAAQLNSLRETKHSFTPVVSAISQSTNSQQQNRLPVSSSQHLLKTTSAPFSKSGDTNVLTQALPVHPSMMPQTFHNVLPPHSMPIPSLASRVSSTLSGSVISSELTNSSSCPISHESNLVQSQSNSILFHPASCASSIGKSPPSPHMSSSSNTLSSSSSVLQTQPSLLPSSAQSTSQVPGRLKSADSSNTPCSYQLLQAATSEAPGGSSVKASFPNLLNTSWSDKPLESSQSLEHSPQEKICSEGDDNSNHSSMVVENVTESSGTPVLLEHSGVKAENHDSGVGSSSERSDDTPSEPGDGEFRSNSNGTEAEDASAKAAKRVVNCKVESGVDSSTSNTITVGYITSVDCSSQPSVLQTKDALDVAKSSVSLSTIIQDTGSDAMYDSRVQSSEKSLERLSSNHALSSVSWVVEMNKNQSPAQRGKLKLNGPLQEDKDSSKKLLTPEIKLNGPSSDSEIGKMFIAMDDLQEQSNSQLKLSPTIKDNSSGLLKLKDEELDEFVKISRSTMSSEQGLGKANVNDKAYSPDHLSHSLGSGEDRLEQLNYFDMEDLVNGRLLGNGAVIGDNKAGGNITSIYSKRSSPVNVNMLNHIYAPGLPLPRRLTESVQRLVKPLPASETSMPQMRLCKSPGIGLPRAVQSVNGPSVSRMSFHSGTRSPGASMPKLIPNDKHSLLSGGLDLAGLSSVSYQQAFQTSDMHLGKSCIGMKTNSEGVIADFPLQDSQHLSSSSAHTPSISMDSVVHAHKILSQSYPPHKSRDLSSNVALYDLFSHIQPPCSSTDNSNLPVTSHNSQIDLNATVQTSKTSCDFGVSPPFSKTQAWKSAQRQLMSKEGALTNHTPVTSCHTTSNSNSLSHTALEGLPRLEENTSHSMNFFYEVVSSSSPEHSSTVQSSAPVLQSKNFTDPVINSSIESSQSLSSATSSMPWSNVSLPNGGSSTLSGDGPLTMVSTSRHVPYLPYSSNMVTSTSESSAGCAIPRVAVPSMSKALLSTTTSNESSHTLTTKSENILPSRLSPKSDISSPRAGTVALPLRRNLFESVSGDLNPLQSVSSHTSLCRTLDAAIPQCSNSVLGASESLKTLKDTFPSSTDSESLDLMSLQSIRTNETPSTSLPAQVVHLDFPHYSSPTASLCGSSIQAELPKPPKTTPIPASQTHQALSNSNWALPETNSTSFILAPTSKSSPHASTQESSPVESIMKTIASVASGQSEALLHNVKEKSSPLSTPVKEPILETLASSLDPSLKKNVTITQQLDVMENKSTGSALTAAKFSKTSEDFLNKDQSTLQDESSDQSMSEVLGIGEIQHPPVHLHESPARKVSRKRSLPGSEIEHKDGSIDSMAFEPPPAKRHHHETNDSLPKTAVGSDTKEEPIVSEFEVDSTKLKSPVDKGLNIVDELGHTSNDQSSLLRQGTENDGSASVKQDDILVSQVTFPLPVPEGELNLSQSFEKRTVSEEKNGNSVIVENNLSEDSKPQMADGQLESESKVEGKLNITSDAPEPDKSLGDKDKTHDDMFAADKEAGDRNDSIVKEDEGIDKELKANKPNQLPGECAKEDVKDTNTPSLHTSAKSNLESKPEDTAKKGRVKRQFYAYVPEKSIDQTYFDTPILSGRTRSRNKTVEPAQTETLPSQDGTHVSSGEMQIVGGKGEATQENSAGKRSTRSLRTKETSQDPASGKRRRIQSREHR